MSDDPTSSRQVSLFEQIKHTDEHGEFWSARELAKVLGYALWQNFVSAIQRAKTACENSGQRSQEHFIETNRMVEIGNKAKRPIQDFHLSRYACYLIVQNADPSKEIVALGQTYFAVRTRRDEIREENAEALEEARLRLEERDKLKRYNRELFRTARDAGVITPQDFAIFEDHGYKGLYNGETARDIAARKGLKLNHNIADYMGSTETAANGFRAALAREMLRSEDVHEKDAANTTHHTAGHIVRKAMQDAGVAPPERLPTPAKSIQQLRREEVRRKSIEEEDRLGLFAQLLATESGAPSADPDDDGDA